jgi:hypothetical protein
MHCSRCLPLISAVFAVAAPRAQAIWNVGPGGFPTIPAALAVANPGDFIDLAPGTYAAFDCSIGVTFRAQVPGSVECNLDIGFLPGTGVSTQWNAPPGQTIHAVGVRLRFPAASPTVPSVQPQLSLGGNVVLEECTLTSLNDNAKGSVQVGPAAVVHLQNVVARGPVLVVDGRATAVQCDLRGPLLMGFTQPAVWVQGSLHASHCVLVGGSSSLQAGGAGLRVETNGKAWLTDCTVQRGDGLGASCAVAGGGAIQLARCTTNTPACLPAPATAGLGVQRLSPVVGGATFAIAYRSDPLFPVGVHLSFGLVSVPLPFAVQPWGAPLGGSFEVAFGMTDALGDLTLPFAIPANPVFTGLPLWFHGVSGLTLPLQVAPAVGGRVR